MKKILIISILILLNYTGFAQKDITTFLGIPIDGFKPQMIEKLKEKGYTVSSEDKDILQGEFNGHEVNIHIATNNNKVWRIMVCDNNTIGETDIKIRFNNLCDQFSNNGRYMSFLDNQKISDTEDISYEMTVNNKRYQANFFQSPNLSATDTLALQNELMEIAQNKYSETELINPTEEIKIDLLVILGDIIMKKCSMKSVWFMIVEHYGKYYIAMYYDNEYNKANGEDL